MFRASRSEEKLSLTATAVEEAREYFGTHDERKVVLIVGASRSVGFELLKLYSVEKDTRIIAVSTGAGKNSSTRRVFDRFKFSATLFFFFFFRTPSIACQSQRSREFSQSHVSV